MSTRLSDADIRRRTRAYAEHTIRELAGSGPRGTKAKLAATLGCSGPHITNIVQGSRGLSDDLVEGLATKWLKVTLTQFQNQALRWAEDQPKELWAMDEFPERSKAIEAGKALGFPEGALQKLRELRPPPDELWDAQAWFTQLQAIVARLQSRRSGAPASKPPRKPVR